MLLALIGHAALYVALAAAVAGCAASVAVARGRSGTRTLAISRAAPTLVLAATAAASALLVTALLRSEFAIAYVANHTNSELAPVFRLSAWWGGQEGSLLLWTLVLAGYTVAVDRTHMTRPAAARAAARAILLAMAGLFAALIAFVAPVFALVEEVPPDGSGLAVALQNYWMAIHPPLLYLGYVGALVPFAVLAAAAFTGQPARAWVRVARTWTLVAWGFLTAGLAFGARWAYEEIGWGGYWGWDPVENVALLPWLVLGAMLHSLRLLERRGQLPAWNASLATAAAALAVFGTFVTRSGLVESVHAFVESPTGWYFLGLLAVVMGAGVALVLRAVRQPAAPRIERLDSREGSFLGNGLLLTSLTLAVLWGVLQPVVTEAALGLRSTVSNDYYNTVLAAFGIPLLIVMAIGQAQAWSRPGGSFLRRLAWPTLAALVASVLTEAAAPGTHLLATAAIGLAVVVIASATYEFVARARELSPSAGGLGRGARVALAGSRRRFGGYLAHVGIGVLAIGIVGSGLHQGQVERELAPGERTTLGAYELTYLEPVRRAAGTSMEVAARFEVARGGDTLGQVEAGRVFHTVQGEITNEVGILADWPRLTDLMLVVDTMAEDGTATVQAFANPLVDLVWLSAILMVGGACLAGAPRRPARGGTGPNRPGTTKSWNVPAATPSSTIAKPPAPTAAPRTTARP